jgi:hypothetical protein
LLSKMVPGVTVGVTSAHDPAHRIESYIEQDNSSTIMAED